MSGIADVLTEAASLGAILQAAIEQNLGGIGHEWDQIVGILHCSFDPQCGGSSCWCLDLQARLQQLLTKTAQQRPKMDDLIKLGVHMVLPAFKTKSLHANMVLQPNCPIVALLRGWSDVWLSRTHCDIPSGYIESQAANQGRCQWRRQPVSHYSCCCQTHSHHRGCWRLLQRLWCRALGCCSSKPCLLWRWVWGTCIEQQCRSSVASPPPPPKNCTVCWALLSGQIAIGLCLGSMLCSHLGN